MKIITACAKIIKVFSTKIIIIWANHCLAFLHIFFIFVWKSEVSNI